MLTPDDIVATLWDTLVAGPPTWGQSDGHPRVRGLGRAVGLLFVPIGFLGFVTVLILVVAPFAVIYDIVEVLSRRFRNPRR